LHDGLGISTKTMKQKGFIAAAGFTLIELLVVISIIGILAGMITVSFTSSQKQARDTERKSDLTQYRTLLESFANKNNGLYPSRHVSGGQPASTTLCTDLVLTGCPEDPKYASDNTYQYKYQSDGTGSGTVTGTTYVLWAKLENVTNMFWVVCSTGQSGKIASSTTFTDGACPAGLIP
jgi:prepilin-type N-terminal cleavage/methylation domain-containing protein